MKANMIEVRGPAWVKFEIPFSWRLMWIWYREGKIEINMQVNHEDDN